MVLSAHDEANDEAEDDKDRKLTPMCGPVFWVLNFYFSHKFSTTTKIEIENQVNNIFPL